MDACEVGWVAPVAMWRMECFLKESRSFLSSICNCRPHEDKCIVTMEHCKLQWKATVMPFCIQTWLHWTCVNCTLPPPTLTIIISCSSYHQSLVTNWQALIMFSHCLGEFYLFHSAFILVNFPEVNAYMLVCRFIQWTICNELSCKQLSVGFCNSHDVVPCDCNGSRLTWPGHLCTHRQQKVFFVSMDLGPILHLAPFDRAVLHTVVTYKDGFQSANTWPIDVISTLRKVFISTQTLQSSIHSPCEWLLFSPHPLSTELWKHTWTLCNLWCTEWSAGLEAWFTVLFDTWFWNVIFKQEFTCPFRWLLPFSCLLSFDQGTGALLAVCL